MYDNTREQLRRKEEQHRLEGEKREKEQLSMRNLELEMRALVNNMKQVRVSGLASWLTVCPCRHQVQIRPMPC